MTPLQSIKGFKDILPGESELWQSIEQQARTIFSDFGFREIRMPLLEKTELFARSIGESTDIVEKEMYTFQDRSGGLLTMRPEATAGIVRERFPSLDVEAWLDRNPYQDQDLIDRWKADLTSVDLIGAS